MGEQFGCHYIVIHTKRIVPTHALNSTKTDGRGQHGIRRKWQYNTKSNHHRK